MGFDGATPQGRGPRAPRLGAIMASTKVSPATLPDGITATFALDVDGGTLSAPMSARTFGTGSVGFSTAGKVTGEDGRRYQVSVNVVLIGSKPSA